MPRKSSSKCNSSLNPVQRGSVRRTLTNFNRARSCATKVTFLFCISKFPLAPSEPRDYLEFRAQTGLRPDAPRLFASHRAYSRVVLVFSSARARRRRWMQIYQAVGSCVGRYVDRRVRRTARVTGIIVASGIFQAAFRFPPREFQALHLGDLSSPIGDGRHFRNVATYLRIDVSLNALFIFVKRARRVVRGGHPRSEGCQRSTGSRL